MRNTISEKGREINNNVQRLKSHSGELKVIKENMQGVQQSVAEVSRKQ